MKIVSVRSVVLLTIEFRIYEWTCCEVVKRVCSRRVKEPASFKPVTAAAGGGSGGGGGECLCKKQSQEQSFCC